MKDLPPAVVEDLIALGCLGDRLSAERDELLARLTAFDRAKYLGWGWWNKVAGTHSEVELRNLVRCLTAVEFELGWHGGFDAGVSPELT
jgi:hypothetical protein